MDTPKQTFSALLIKTPEHDRIFAEQRKILCPACGKRVVLWVLPTSQVRDLPVKCRKCNAEMILNIPPLSLSP